ncbi:MAG: flagellar protein FlaG [Woeseiaceae bacterium]|nr:flagellar protein FlaG [Woeseiaceae bacterium]
MTGISGNAMLSGTSPYGSAYGRTAPSSGGNAVPEAGKTSPPPLPGNRLPELNSLVEALNNKSRSIGRAIRFQVNLDSPTAIVQVIDRETGRLVRQIPYDQAAVMAHNARSLDLQRVIDVV